MSQEAVKAHTYPTIDRVVCDINFHNLAFLKHLTI